MTKQGFWLHSEPLVLASSSAARRNLLEACAIPLRIIKPQVDEASIAAALLRKSATPQAIAASLAEAKGRRVSAEEPGALVLAADQTLDHAGVLLMKPESYAAARDQLSALRANSHHLHAAATLWRGDICFWRGISSARLTMRDFSDEFIDAYLARMDGTALESPGSYQIEALGPHLFEEIAGDHATILGLPLLMVLSALRKHGVLLT